MIDIHLHTNHSDGSASVSELLKEAENKKLSIISITDHNVVSAYEELNNSNIRNLFSGNIINGCEITTVYNGETIEILGYNFNLDVMKKLLDKNVLTTEDKQQKEYELIKKQFKKIGVKFDDKNIIFDPKESSRVAFCNEVKRYKENDHFFLYEESITSPFGFTRKELYNPESPLYVDESSLFPSLKKTISLIHKAGGKAFLAHVYAYSEAISSNLDKIINNYDLDGIECYYTTFTEQQTKYLINFCNTHNLYKCGGSDFHGDNKINHNMGIGHGNMIINSDLISNWYNINNKKGDEKWN